MPWVVELGSNPNLLSWDTRVPDAKSDFSLVAVGKLVSNQQSFLRGGIIPQTAVSI